jgi:ribonucleoside-diphosphate reductase alpha subunit
MFQQKLEPMFVIKRGGKKEIVYFDKITNRLKKLMYDIDDIDPVLITQKLCSRIVSGITTTELDNLASQICMSMLTVNPNYGILGARISISNHQKNTDDNFLTVLSKLKNNKDIHDEISPMINEELFMLGSKYEKEINNMIEYDRDYLLDFFGFKTLEKSYLLKINKKSVERPQHLFMRVALAIHGDDLLNVKKTYDNLSLKNYTHATPTLFNGGCPNQQLSSCFLLATEDSIEGIFGTITDCAKISKWSGGIGIHVSNIRANGSYIRKTAGYSDGIMPMLKVYNDVARYINQGGGKRNGSFAIYIEPWHADIFTFLDAKKNHGSEELRARDLFYALWIPDLFMKAIENNGDWYLMCPDKCPRLPDVYGEDFDKLYLKYVGEERYNKKIKARELWDAIISSQIETGTPYMLYKDASNKKSNQKNIDTIKSSNLCAEIVEVSNSEETAVCNLSSICLPSILEYPNKSYHDWYDLLTIGQKQLSEYYFKGQLKLFSDKDCTYCKLLKALLKENGLEYEEITEKNAEHLRTFCLEKPEKFTTVPQLFSIIPDGEVDEIKYLGGYTNTWNLLSPKINHNKLRDLSFDLVINLNKIIDKNYYPTEKTKVSNLRHRPIGIGVQGLADLFLCLKIPFDSLEARKINKEIFETIYFGTLDSSNCLAIKDGPYSTFHGSPISEGIFQYNMWGLKDEDLSDRWKWNALRKNIMKNGIRNSLLVALMPTASTSQIMGSYVECFEPLTSNLYTRRTLAGEFVIINPFLIKDLINLDMWNDDIKNRLQYDKGSVKNIKNFPFKDIYRTVWEIPQKSLLEMSADRGAFVCQSQSLNLFFEKPEYKKLSMAHIAGWKLGLKTGSYYIRSKPATSAQRFAMDPDIEKKLKEEDLQHNEENECLNCGA